MANFPNSVTTFVTRNPGDTIPSADNNLFGQEINAIEDGYINGTARLNSSNSTVNSLSVTNNCTVTLDVTARNFKNSSVVTLTDVAAVSLNVALGKVFQLTSTTNATISVTGTPYDGQPIVIRYKAVTSARTLTLSTAASNFAFGSDVTGLTATSSGKTDIIGCLWDGNSSMFSVVAVVKGY